MVQPQEAADMAQALRAIADDPVGAQERAARARANAERECDPRVWLRYFVDLDARFKSLV